jgi:hypothetical protein
LQGDFAEDTLVVRTASSVANKVSMDIRRDETAGVTGMITHNRLISAAPFRDRVVHHAVCNVVMPLFERKMIFDLYSNRVGKGTHVAIRRAQKYCRQFDFVLKCDVRIFFPSIDHEVLKGLIRQTIACRDTLWLLDKIVDGSNRQEPVCQVFSGDDLAEAAARRVGRDTV